MTQNQQTYLNKSATFAAYFFKQLYSFNTNGQQLVNASFTEIREN